MAGRTAGFFHLVRTYTGLLSAGILNLGAFGLQFKSICSPGFNCHGCPWAAAACPVGVLAYGSAVRTFPAMAAGLVLAAGALTGRLVCGFACPFGWFQDLLHRIPSPKFRLPRFARHIKYAALGLLVFLLPFALGFKYTGLLKVEKPRPDQNASGGLDVRVKVTNYGTEPIEKPALDVVFLGNAKQEELFRERREFPAVTVPPGGSVELPAFSVPNKLAEADLKVSSPQSAGGLQYHYELYYCRLCPNGTLTAALPAVVADRQTGLLGGIRRSLLRFGILAFFLVFMVAVSRAFCRTFCPLGAIYGLGSFLALSRVRVHEADCTHCNLCSKVCPVDLDVAREAGGPECIACGDCIRACPHDAITREFGIGSRARVKKTIPQEKETVK